MLIRVVTNYLAAHRRLVVPQLGVFLVKKPGESVLFSELMKRDDGVLRALLCEAGVGELEAAGEIDRFVFEVRHAVERGESYPLEGFGRMMPGPGGSIVFEYAPESAAPDTEASMTATSSDAPAAAAAPETPETPETPNPAAARSDGDDETDPDGPRPSSHIRPDRVADKVKSAFAGEPVHVSASATMNPEPCVRGLRYGKPRKTTDAYRYVDRAPRRRSLDRFLLLGILVAAIAVGAILYGWWVGRQAERIEQQPLELPAAAPEASEAPDTSE